MKRKLTKREGKRLNDEGRLSPMEVIQAAMEDTYELYVEEKAKGVLGSHELIAEYRKSMVAYAVELMPYREARRQAIAVAHGTTSDLELLLREIEANDPGPLAHVRKLDAPH